MARACTFPAKLHRQPCQHASLTRSDRRRTNAILGRMKQIRHDRHTAISNLVCLLCNQGIFDPKRSGRQ